MTTTIKLRNSDKQVIVDDKVYEWLTTDPEMVRLRVLNYLCLHDSPRVIYSRKVRISKKQYEKYHFYLHTLIGEHFLKRPESDEKLVIGAINGNLLDCRLENLRFQGFGVGRRKSAVAGVTGYRGVYPAGNRYKAVINDKEGYRCHIGYYATARLAAIAFNEESLRLFGEFGKQNVIPETDPEPEKLLAKKYSRNQPEKIQKVA